MGLHAHALMAHPLESGAQFPRGGLRARGAGAWGWGEQSHCRLLTPSTRYSLVSCGSWALAFRQLMAWWSHPATSRRLPPSQPSRGGLVGSSIICSSLFFCGVRMRISLPGDSRAVYGVRSLLWLFRLRFTFRSRVSPPGSRKVLNRTIESNHYLECFGLWSPSLVLAVTFYAVKTLSPR